MTFWEISIDVNFINFVFPEMMRNSIFDLENGGSTYTRVNTVDSCGLSWSNGGERMIHLKNYYPVDMLWVNSFPN